ncbi:MAG: recombinase family protein [Bacillota bacterium]|nr:recombinase family protein [Bacillota bacterium]
MARYGYILLDEQDADIGRQAMQLDTIGDFTRIFIDRHFNKTKNREQRNRLIEQLQPGDVVYAAAVDRFSSNLKDFLQSKDQILNAGAEIVLLEEALDSRSVAGRQVIRVLAAFDRLDFRYQSERKKDGIRRARASGRRIGRPPVSIPPGFRDICRRWSEGQISGRDAAAQSGLRSTSFYKKAAELGFSAPGKKRT